MGNHVGLTIMRDSEVETAIDFKKERMEWRLVRVWWRLVRVWVFANNLVDNRRMKRKLLRAGLRCNEFSVAINFVASHHTFIAYVD
ncbi:unnamed protein product, partial [Prunus brigantina]